MYVNQPNMKYHAAAHKEATVFSYFGDGTGRDSYVVANSGGLIPRYIQNGPIANFKESLRKHPMNVAPLSARSRSNSQNRTSSAQVDSAVTGQPWFPSKVKELIRTCYNHQMTQSQRLATPKFNRSRFGGAKSLRASRNYAKGVSASL